MNSPPPKQYDLADRTLSFAKRTRALVRKLPKTIATMEDGRQLVRSSGSVGANYIEANEALGPKDFLMKIRISRKEAKESRYWLLLLDVADNELLEHERQLLVQESQELMLIFSAMVRNILQKKSSFPQK